jgi:hypothetical protein
VRLLSAQIGVDLDCDGGALSNPFQLGIEGTGKALSADGAIVRGKVSLRNGFQADGEVELTGIQIGFILQCDGGKFNNRSDGAKQLGSAINFGGAIVQGDISLGRGFRSHGHLNIVGAQITGDLVCTQARFDGIVNVQRTVIKGAFVWIAVADPELTTLDLRDVSAGALKDDSLSWPPKGNIRLDGFVYQRISEGPRDSASRLKWLALQESFTPQPYRQLAKALRESGDEDGAKTVLVKMEQRLRTGEWSSPFLRLGVGYGYYPLRAIGGLLILSAVGWIFFRRAYLAGSMTPTDKDSYEYFTNGATNGGAPPPHYTRFSPSVYSIENSLPLVKLGQADHWQPDPQKIPVVSGSLLSVAYWQNIFSWFWGLATSPKSWWSSFLEVTLSPVFLRRFVWFQIIFGWILATFFAAGVTGIIRKD